MRQIILICSLTAIGASLVIGAIVYVNEPEPYSEKEERDRLRGVQNAIKPGLTEEDVDAVLKKYGWSGPQLRHVNREEFERQGEKGFLKEYHLKRRHLGEVIFVVYFDEYGGARKCDLYMGVEY